MGVQYQRIPLQKRVRAYIVGRMKRDSPATVRRRTFTKQLVVAYAIAGGALYGAIAEHCQNTEQSQAIENLRSDVRHLDSELRDLESRVNRLR